MNLLFYETNQRPKVSVSVIVSAKMKPKYKQFNLPLLEQD
jgi:hypothetical protein